jgi:hypothetical protein
MKHGKQIKSVNLRSLDGAREVSFGPASYEARMTRDLSKNGKALAAAKTGDFADDKARQDRWASALML